MTAESEDERDSEEYRKLLDLYDESMRNLTEGEIVTGRVIGVTSNAVIVDVGYKSEGLIPIEEFTDRGGEMAVKVGEEVDVLLEKTEDLEGHVLLSYSKAQRMRRWTEVERAYKEGRIIKGRVIDRIKGGLTVDVGLRAFLPGSLVDIKPVKNLESLRGQELEFKVISLDRRRNNIVLSRKAVLETELREEEGRDAEAAARRARALKGAVKNITDYGVFIDLGGIDGLLHITDISWGRVNHPSEHFSVGDEVEVVVLKFDPETERVSLGLQAAVSEDPWTLVDKKYPIGSRVHGRVVSHRRLRRLRRDRGGRRGPDPRQRDVVDQEGRQSRQDPGGRATRSRRSSPSSTWSSGASACRCARPSATRGRSWRTPIPVGTVIEGKVRNLTEFGAFVEITEGIDGLIHVSDMSWTKRVKHPSEVLKKGDTVKARITNIDVENQRVSLSIKEFMPNEWEDFAERPPRRRHARRPGGQRHRLRSLHRHLHGLEGLAHVSEIDVPAGAKLEDHFKVGDWVRARILRIEEEEKKVGLSMRGVSQPSEEEIAELQATAAKRGGG